MQWIIAINVAVFFLQLTVVRPADIVTALAFKSPGDLTQRPWTIATYMFVHAGFLHLAFNMWTLWLFGPRLEQAWGQRSFSFYYLLCGLGGWLADLLIVHNGYAATRRFRRDLRCDARVRDAVAGRRGARAFRSCSSR